MQFFSRPNLPAQVQCGGSWARPEVFGLAIYALSPSANYAMAPGFPTQDGCTLPCAELPFTGRSGHAQSRRGGGMAWTGSVPSKALIHESMNITYTKPFCMHCKNDTKSAGAHTSLHLASMQVFSGSSFGCLEFPPLSLVHTCTKTGCFHAPRLTVEVGLALRTNGMGRSVPAVLLHL